MDRSLVDTAEEMFAVAWKDLSRKKLRSFLTALGIIFGIASVVSMLAVGEGAQKQILKEMQVMGINNILISSQKPSKTQQQSSSQSSGFIAKYGLTNKDFKIIKKTVATCEYVTITKNHKDRMWHGNRKERITLKGVKPDFIDMVKIPMLEGYFFSPINEKSYHNVCVVPKQLLHKLKLPFTTGYKVRVGEHFYEITGIYDSADLPEAILSEKKRFTVFIPFNVSLHKLGMQDVAFEQGNFTAERQEISEIICQVKSEDDVFRTAGLMEKILDKNHPKGDYQISIPLQLLRQRQKTQNIFNIVMVLIAAISLIVGGIGIINIMLATVSERTREIGIRRAIGARKKDIVLQFLIETIVLCIFAGICGCVLGIGVIKGITIATGWKAVIKPFLFIFAFFIACTVGVVFGLYPARKASELNPVDALRFE
jgi:putative ABC transport system permease protein